MGKSERLRLIFMANISIYNYVHRILYRSIYHFDPDNLPAGCQTHNHNVDLNAMETGAEATECCNLIAQVRQNCDTYAADEIDAEGVDEECIENGPPAMLYPNDMYATASDERMLESASEPHIHELDERYDSSSEVRLDLRRRLC